MKRSIPIQLRERGGRSKYGAKACVIDGHRFASHKEGRRYRELVTLESGHVIGGLELQPKYLILINGRKCGEYRGDFRYTDLETLAEIVEDVKGVRTPVYKLKKKLVEAIYGIEILEV
jgi:hypothetical protein